MFYLFLRGGRSATTTEAAANLSACPGVVVDGLATGGSLRGGHAIDRCPAAAADVSGARFVAEFSANGILGRLEALTEAGETGGAELFKAPRLGESLVAIGEGTR